MRAEVKQTTEHLTQTVLAPLNARMNGPLQRSPFSEGIPLPFVLLLGNHSSGKSSFINYVLGRQVQATGVAPTDDGFTVIKPGAEDIDRDGASFISDPTMGFAPLRSFGPSFISHFKLKVRDGLSLDQIMLIDSPGMIDSPAKLPTMPLGADPVAETGRLRPAGATSPRSQERGYDFLGVTRWLARSESAGGQTAPEPRLPPLRRLGLPHALCRRAPVGPRLASTAAGAAQAEHADVILLFFDPDKPGTTGETLQCLTSSLRGTEHKLHIVMNKVDQF